MPTDQKFKLAICIATFNRAALLKETLSNICSQITDECEVIVSDNDSEDETEQVVQEFAARYGSNIRYSRNESNVGFDRNVDRAVSVSNSEYCWLMSDDDVLKPFAVSTVRKNLDSGLDLIILNIEYRTNDMSRLVEASGLRYRADRIYEPEELDRLFCETATVSSYIGSIVIKRDLWMSRERERYHGCAWIHLGVIFQDKLPGRTLVLATPLITYRCGLQHTEQHASKLLTYSAIGYPAVIRSSALSEPLKEKLLGRGFRSSILRFLQWRALGFYAITDYRTLRRQPCVSEHRLAAILPLLLPGRLVNLMYVLFTVLVMKELKGLSLHILSESRYHYRGVVSSARRKRSSLPGPSEEFH